MTRLQSDPDVDLFECVSCGVCSASRIPTSEALTAYYQGYYERAGAADDKEVLTVYTYDSFISDWGPGPKIEEAFEAQCECDLNFVGLDSSIGILSRLRLEGDHGRADLVLGLDMNLMAEAKAIGLPK